MDYYVSYKNSKDLSLLRKELIDYALSYGNKKAAQQFQTTVKTEEAECSWNALCNKREDCLDKVLQSL